MTLIQLLKQTFRKPTALEVATAELANAELEKLAAETALDWAEASVQYNTSRILRLRAFINAATKESL